MGEYPLWWEWVSGHIKPIPIWDPINRFVVDYRDILTKDQILKLATVQARLQTEALKIRMEFDAKISELGLKAATEVQKLGVSK